MRNLRNIVIFVLLILGLSWAGQSYLGAMGYAFVPDAFVDHGRSYGGYFAGEWTSLQKDRLYPKYLGFYWTSQSKRLEIGLSSSYAFVTDDKGFDPQKIGNGLAPVIPAIKWNIDDQYYHQIRIAFAVGAMFPYGAYGAVTLKPDQWPWLQPELTLVAATTAVKSSHAMGGMRLYLADSQGKTLPLALSAETGWAGSMESLGKVSEGFYAYGLEVAMGRHLTLQILRRVDPNTYEHSSDPTQVVGQNDQGRWSLKLDYSFNGVKSAESYDQHGGQHD